MRAKLLERMPRAKLHLKFKGITGRTLRLYKREVSRFFEYLELEDQQIPATAVDLDECMAEFINVLYQEGESISHAGWLLSGMKRFLPRVRRELLTSQQFYNNWVRDHTPVRAVPFPWVVVRTMAGLAFQQGHPDIALLLLVGFSFFLRTMEMLKLEIEDIVVDGFRGTTFVALHETKTSKQFQQSLVFQNPQLAQLVTVLKGKLPPAGGVWRHSVHTFRQCFQALLEALHVAPLRFTMYSLRRGGATHGYIQSHNLDKIARQGRWKDHKTAKIYLDDARAALIQMDLPQEFRAKSSQIAKFWQQFLE